MDWFLYDNGLRHERVKSIVIPFVLLLNAALSVANDDQCRRKWEVDSSLCTQLRSGLKTIKNYIQTHNSTRDPKQDEA